MRTKSTTMAITARYAPRVNLVSSTTISTDPVSSTPTKLTTLERRILARTAGSGSMARNRVQCLTMPIWLIVNETKTPTM